MLNFIKNTYNIAKAIFAFAVVLISSLLFFKTRSKIGENNSKKKHSDINKSQGKKEVLSENLSSEEKKIEKIDGKIKDAEDKIAKLKNEENKEELDEFFDKRGF